MKKALSLVLAAVMAFSLVACGGSSSSTASAGNAGSASGSATASNVTVEQIHSVTSGMCRLIVAKSTRNSHSPAIMNSTTSTTNTPVGQEGMSA